MIHNNFVVLDKICLALVKINGFISQTRCIQSVAPKTFRSGQVYPYYLWTYFCEIWKIGILVNGE
jgi:hypothetical protein